MPELPPAPLGAAPAASPALPRGLRYGAGGAGAAGALRAGVASGRQRFPSPLPCLPPGAGDAGCGQSGEGGYLG